MLRAAGSLLLAAIMLSGCAREAPKPTPAAAAFQDIDPAAALVRFVAPPTPEIARRSVAGTFDGIYVEHSVFQIGPYGMIMLYREARSGTPVAALDMTRTLRDLPDFKGKTLRLGEEVAVTAPAVERYRAFTSEGLNCAGFTREWSPSLERATGASGYERAMLGYVCANGGGPLPAPVVQDFLARIGIERREMPSPLLRQKRLVL